MAMLIFPQQYKTNIRPPKDEGVTVIYLVKRSIGRSLIIVNIDRESSSHFFLGPAAIYSYCYSSNIPFGLADGATKYENNITGLGFED